LEDCGIERDSAVRLGVNLQALCFRLVQARSPTAQPLADAGAEVSAEPAVDRIQRLVFRGLQGFRAIKVPWKDVPTLAILF